MRNIIKKRNPNIKKDRAEFKKLLLEEMSVNTALAMAIITTYSSYKHKRHIYRIWNFLAKNYHEAFVGYQESLLGKHLSGNDTIWKTLRHGGCEALVQAYYSKIPETIVMGDALTMAYKHLNVR